MTARQAGRAGAGQLAPLLTPASSLLQWRESRTAGDGMVSRRAGSRQEYGEDREGRVEPGDYAAISTCYGCVKSYTAANNQCPTPLYPQNEGLSSEQKNHEEKFLKQNVN